MGSKRKELLRAQVERARLKQVERQKAENDAPKKEETKPAPKKAKPALKKLTEALKDAIKVEEKKENKEEE